jgi:hypothetical protein
MNDGVFVRWRFCPDFIFLSYTFAVSGDCERFFFITLSYN